MDRYGLICRSIYENKNVTQRELSSILGVSLGTVNHLVKECIEQKLIEAAPEQAYYNLTKQGVKYLEPYKVDGALITAAGFGSRFVPLTFETPKGLLEVFGERMIERQIKQLHEVGITNITIAVGYLKEKFEYLIDKYNVELLYNPEYSTKNTLATLWHARDILKGKNMYILPSDIWLRDNMYHTYECGAWCSAAYMKGETSEWCLQYNKKGRITDVSIGGSDAWVMYGPTYFSREFMEQYLPILDKYYEKPGTEQFYWEQMLVDHPELYDIYVNFQKENQVYEFENLEELRLFDPKYQNHSDNEALELVAHVLKVPESSIQNIRCLKAGMTNKSFLFKVHDTHYICRIPGPGTSLLINRKQEKASYDAVMPLGITERIIYFDGETGYKIAKYYEGARNADARNWDDMQQCMALVRKLHRSAVKVSHSFDVRERISFYEKLCPDILFEDYKEVRKKMNQILDRLDQLNRPQTLSHIDSVADNFLFLPDGGIRLIDWEYAGMCDPLIDVSMCAIYSYYNEAEVDKLIQIYLDREPTDEERFVVYAYIALGGFLWTLWAVYKNSLGEEFGEYSLIMYRYAKKYYKKLF